MTKNVTFTAAAVRKAFADGTLDASKVLDKDGNPVSTASLTGTGPTGPRGRIHPAFIAAAEAAGMGTYSKSTPARVESLVTLPLTKPNSKGAMLKRPEQVPASEVRRLAGITATRGRLSKDAIAKATTALMTERGWVK